MTRDRRLPIARGSRRDHQRSQLFIDIEVPQMRADQMEEPPDSAGNKSGYLWPHPRK
jgi:hypothetical protein